MLTILQCLSKITAFIFYALRSSVDSCVFFQTTRCHAEGILISMCSGLLSHVIHTNAVWTVCAQQH